MTNRVDFNFEEERQLKPQKVDFRQKINKLPKIRKSITKKSIANVPSQLAKSRNKDVGGDLRVIKGRKDLVARNYRREPRGADLTPLPLGSLQIPEKKGIFKRMFTKKPKETEIQKLERLLVEKKQQEQLRLFKEETRKKELEIRNQINVQGKVSGSSSRIPNTPVKSPERLVDIQLVPFDDELYKRCPVCQKKVKKWNVKSLGNGYYSQKMKCKNKLCDFEKEISVRV